MLEQLLLFFFYVFFCLFLVCSGVLLLSVFLFLPDLIFFFTFIGLSLQPLDVVILMFFHLKTARE